MSDRAGVIRTGDQEFAVGQCGFCIEPHMGREDHPLGGWIHSLSLHSEPVNDQFPHFVMTNVDLYLRGRIPNALDGLRIKQSLEGGDYPPPWITAGRWLFKKHWIRPGSTVGMSCVIYSPPSISFGTERELNKNLYLCANLEVSFDRVEQNVWRIEIVANHEGERDEEFQPKQGGLPGGKFHTIYFSELEIETYDE